MPVELQGPAAQLLKELQAGDNVAEPSVYVGSLSFNDHAIAYLNNAAALCRTGALDDFRVFGALYCLRHGLELWLKCIEQNATIDRTLEAIAMPQSTFESVATAAGQTDKKKRKVFLRALCAVRNVVEDQVVAPDCWGRNVSPEHAERAISMIRAMGKEPRYKIAIAWSVPIDGHDIAKLWTRAKGDVEDMWRGAAAHAREIGFQEPMAPERMTAICELLGALDDAGVAFRYPTTLDGKWHVGLPHMSLTTLASLIDRIESTVRVYDSFLGEAYQFSTLRSPKPQYSDY